MTSLWRHARLLVVDDNRFDRELMREALEGVARVECCASAQEALEALRREPADLVLSDFSMPEFSGLDLLQAVRREHPGTDFMLLTAHASVDSAVEALRLGAADYLRKPIRPEELAHAVQRSLGRRKLLSENRQLRETLQTTEACRALTPCLEAGEVYAIALDLCLRALSRWRALALFRRSSLAISMGVVFRGFSESEAQQLREVLLHKALDLDAYSEIASHSAGPLHEALRVAGIATGSLLAVPVRGEQRELGVLWIFEDSRPFEESEVERVRVVAGHAELALQNAEKYSHAKERAFIDDVTDLHNARYLLEALDHELQRAERYGGHLSVIFLDLDRFKLVNDRFGHLVGSRALRQLGAVLAQSVRRVDTLARYGGDEFTILLIDTALDTALRVAERIRRSVEEAAFEGSGEGPLRMTLSAGVATYPQDGRSCEALLDLSDKAMYRAKSLGRNRICSAAELEESGRGESV